MIIFISSICLKARSHQIIATSKEVSTGLLTDSPVITPSDTAHSSKVTYSFTHFPLPQIWVLKCHSSPK